MSDKHISTQFDAELNGISTRVLEMGGLVESQIARGRCADALQQRHRRRRCWRPRSARQRDGDRDRPATCRPIIARRQPTARDLRLLIAITKTDRQPGARRRRGGEHRAHRAAPDQRRRVEPHALPVADLRVRGRAAHRAAAQGARRLRPAGHRRGRSSHDARTTRSTSEFDGLLRKLITYMMEDPRTISLELDLVFVAKAIERVGDHAKNMAEADHLRRQGHRRAAHADRRAIDADASSDEDAR